MKQFFLLVFALFTLIGQAQTTCYYKLTRQIVNGHSSNDVTGGQFISFTKDNEGNSACYESNREGVQVNNSALKYKGYQDGIYTYQGNSYWGNNTYFCFSSDKSVLNVTTKIGDTYIYKKSIAPQNVVTSSLLRGTQRQSNGSGGIIPSIPQTGYNGNYNSGNIGGSSSSNSHIRNTEQEKRDVLNRTYGEKCRACGGSGKCHACNGTKIAHSFGNTYECKVCRNGVCGACNGTGKTSWNR